jgi:hypothetical protein
MTNDNAAKLLRRPQSDAAIIFDALYNAFALGEPVPPADFAVRVLINRGCSDHEIEALVKAAITRLRLIEHQGDIVPGQGRSHAPGSQAPAALKPLLHDRRRARGRLV